MTAERTLTWGAVGALVGGLLVFAGHLVDAISGEGTVLGGSLILVGHVALIFAFLGLAEALRGEELWTATSGTFLAVVGTAVIAAVAYASVVAAAGHLDLDALRGAELVILPGAGILAFHVALILLGLAVAEAGLPTTLGWGLIASSVVIAGGFAFDVLFAVGTFVLGMTLAWLGVVLWDLRGVTEGTELR